MSSHTAPYTAKEIAEIRDRAQWCDGISAKCEAEHRWLATLDADRAEERALAVQAVRTRLGDKEGDALAALYAAFPTVPVGDARASRAGAQPVAWATVTDTMLDNLARAADAADEQGVSVKIESGGVRKIVAALRRAAAVDAVAAVLVPKVDRSGGFNPLEDCDGRPYVYFGDALAKQRDWYARNGDRADTVLALLYAGPLQPTAGGAK